MNEALRFIVVGLSSVFGVGVLVLLLIYFTPNQFEKWLAMVMKAAIKLKIGARALHKQYVRHDFQGRVNEFVKENCPVLPGAAADRVRLEWVDSTVSKQAILDGNVVVVRVKREDPEERSFVHAVCLFVSKSLLFKAKKYISAPQGEATDLLVSLRLLEREKPATVSHFVDDYLHPATDKKRHPVTAEVFDDLVVVDGGRLFYSIFLQELNFLGNKVFGGRKDGVIIREVKELVGFLKKVADREVGDTDVDLDFFGEYCRFAMVIVGKSTKLVRENIKPYVGFINQKLIPAGVETVYLLAPMRNAPYVKQIAAQVGGTFDPYLEAKFTMPLKFKDGGKRQSETYLCILRKRGAQTYIQKAS